MSCSLPDTTTTTTAAASTTNDVVPEDFICPLTLEVMKEPVMTRWGHSFERDAIIRWMEYHDQCPMTRNPLSLQDVIVHRALKARIQAWRRSSLAASSSRTERDRAINNDCCDYDEYYCDKDDLWKDSYSSNNREEAPVLDRYLPFLVSVDSTKAMIRALEENTKNDHKKKNDPTARYALKQLKRQRKEEKKQQRAAIAA